MTLREWMAKAKNENWAVAHFNFSTADQLRAFAEVSRETDLPVMVATSEGEAEFFGHLQAAWLVRSWQGMGYQIFLNADHHKSWESAKKAVDLGYDSVLVDGSKLPYEENVALTKRVVDYAREVGGARNFDITVEGELGYLKGESQLQERVEISKEDYTKPEEAVDFVKKTGVDRLAIVFGNIHGIVMEQEERLDIERLKEIAAAVPETILVLHGASGLADQDVREAIKNGISNVHINTELRVAYHEALKEQFASDPNQTTPYKFLKPSYKATKKVALEKVKLFRNL